MNLENTTPLNILLVETSHERSLLVRRLLAESNIVGRLHTVGSNKEALAYLRRDAPYLSAPSPDFVLLGRCTIGGCDRDFRKEISSSARLRHTQIICLEDTAEEAGESLSTNHCDLDPVNPFNLAGVITAAAAKHPILTSNPTES